jgi:hypothetical protein
VLIQPGRSKLLCRAEKEVGTGWLLIATWAEKSGEEFRTKGDSSLTTLLADLNALLSLPWLQISMQSVRQYELTFQKHLCTTSKWGNWGTKWFK